MSRHQEWDIRCKVYVGGLLINAQKAELESVFSNYGPLKNVWIARNPPGFAFIQFQDPRDAEDAVKNLDGAVICGVRARVEMSCVRTRDYRPRGRDNRRNRSRSRSPAPRNSRRPSRTRRSRSFSPRGRRERSRSATD